MSVSVVIPMYNAGSWIRETLDSVARQSYPRNDIQLVVVDDELTDEGPNVALSCLREYSMNGEVIRHERNGAAGGPRNAGAAAATGEWIQFLDADDLLAPQKLELQAACASGVPNDVAVIYSPWRRYGLRDGHWQPTDSLVAPFVDDDPVLRILQDFDFGYVGPSLIRKSFFREMGGFDETLALGEDYDFALRAAMAGARFCRADAREATFFYRNTPESLWRSAIKSTEHQRRLAQISRRAEEFLRQKGRLSEDARCALASRYGRLLDFSFEYDRESFHEMLHWIRDLGLRDPPHITPNLRVLSKFVGYENAQGLRLSYRRAKKRLHASLGGVIAGVVVSSGDILDGCSETLLTLNIA